MPTLWVNFACPCPWDKWLKSQQDAFCLYVIKLFNNCLHSRLQIYCSIFRNSSYKFEEF